MISPPPVLISYSHTNGTSRTDSLHFAVYLQVRQALEFTRCTKVAQGTGATFEFADPTNQIEALFREFAAGGTAPVVKTLQVYRRMRQAIDAALKQ